MSSDRARVTYDPSRRYHGVVAQQGRVSLEADWNEAQAITGAELTARTLDVVGRAGSPDRGYEITPVADGAEAAGDLLVRAGTLYVGGQRVRATQPLSYADQPDWADREGDPLWRDPAIPREPHELVYLLAREQEVSAVEDQALRDVALGGPDTAQRLRILQRVVRYPTEAQTWEDAWGRLIEEQWRPRGFRVDGASRSLEAAARLQVTAYSPDGAEQPADHGGYLGPNNQLIRIQIARVDEHGAPVLVWGYDNASFLYRLSSSVVSASRTILRLASSPVDAYHQPREHQAVEVLRSAAFLAGDDYIAAGTGAVTQVVTAYSPDSREVVVAAEMPPEYRKKPGEGPPLFLRVWEGEARCAPGQEHELGGSGIRVRLTGPAGAADGDARPYPAGAYWVVAVRPAVGPGARGLVYPRRIVDQPQPPDGPRQWLTPVAFVRWRPHAPRAEDCVPRFGGLVREERAAAPGTVQLGPEEVGGGWGLQDAIDSRAGRDRAVTICLAPGTYELPRPLRIGPEHGRLTIRAAAPGVILRAEPGAAARFLLGMIRATDADGLSLEGLEVHPAHTRFSVDPGSYRNLPERARLLLDAHRARVISIGLHAARCTRLSVEGCQFIFSLPEPDGPDGHRRDEDLFGAAIFGAEEVRGLRVIRCTFASREPISHARRRARIGAAAEGRHHVAVGIAYVPTALAAPPPDGGRETEAARQRGSLSVPLLADAVLDGNTFEQLTAPLVAIGQLGDVRLERNTARGCHAGFWLVTQYGSHVLTLLDRLVNQVGDAYRDLVTAELSALTEPLLFHATAVARALPLALPEDEDADAVVPPRHLEAPSASDDRYASELLHLMSAPDSAQELPSAPAQRERRLRRFLDTFGQARTTRAEPERVAVSAAATLRCVLSISGNVLDCEDAPGLVVLDTAREGGASLTLTGNQLRGRPRPGAVACLYLLRSCAVAANVIVNEIDESHEGAESEGEASLTVLAGRHHGRQLTAVAGNVLVGRSRLPRRPDELPDWASLNGVTRR